MDNRFDFRTGVWRVTNAPGLQVRGTDNTTPGNEVKVNGVPVRFTQGKSFPVFRIQINVTTGWIWGVITPPSANQEHLVCLWDLNTSFAERIGELAVSGSSNGIADALNRIADALEKIARNG